MKERPATVRTPDNVSSLSPPFPVERVGAIVMARMSSRRLPGKVLTGIAGRPMLGYVTSSLERCRAVGEVVVATSDDPSDDPVVTACDELGVPVERGSLDDVAGRMADVVRRRGYQAGVRISGDSPLIDHRLVDRAVAMLRDGGHDAVTNVDPRTFPAGQSVEVLTADALERVLTLAAGPSDREHVTPPLYRHAEWFRLGRLTAERPRPQERMVVDTPSDLVAMRALVEGLPRPHHDYAWEELLGRMTRTAA